MLCKNNIAQKSKKCTHLICCMANLFPLTISPIHSFSYECNMSPSTSHFVLFSWWSILILNWTISQQTIFPLLFSKNPIKAHNHLDSYSILATIYPFKSNTGTNSSWLKTTNSRISISSPESLQLWFYVRSNKKNCNSFSISFHHQFRTLYYILYRIHYYIPRNIWLKYHAAYELIDIG